MGNNTSSPAGSLNLLFGSGSSAPAETGLSIAANGVITFSPGQTFPGGGGGGTITGVTAGTDLTGGGTSGNVTLNVNTSALQIANDLRYAQLDASNFFTAPQTVAGSVSSPQLFSTIGSPNPPLVVSSNAQVANLNASFLGGFPAASFAQVGANTFTGNQSVTGNGESAVVGNMACGAISAGIQLAAGAVNCTGYALLDFNGQTVINRPTGQQMTFREGNGTVEMTIAPGGPVTMASTTNDVFGLTVTASAASAGVFQGGTDSAGFGGEGLEVHGGTDITGNAPNAGPFVQGVTENSAGSGEAGRGLLAVGGTGMGSGIFGGSGIVALGGSGVFSGDAGDFEGNVVINGNLTKSGRAFRIDHPLDPAGKYLYHSFVESPDMKNMYDGVVMMDGNGEAVIGLPEWFGALNRDFRYQLTAIGAPAPGLYIAQEIENNGFRIAGGKPGLKVSWQVTGTRQDAWANAHRIPVEKDKPERERGFYLAPELFGAPPEKGIEWARHPEMMKRIKGHGEKSGSRMEKE